MHELRDANAQQQIRHAHMNGKILNVEILIYINSYGWWYHINNYNYLPNKVNFCVLEKGRRNTHATNNYSL